MKKIYYSLSAIFILLSSILSCTKEDTFSEDVPESQKIDPATDVLDANEQRKRFRDVGEELMDAIDMEAIEGTANTLLELRDIDFDKYSEGKVIDAISDAIDNMVTSFGNGYVAIYNLQELAGDYSFIDGKQEMKKSQNIIVNYENIWNISVIFSSDTRRVLIYDSSADNRDEDEKEYIEVPSSVSILAIKNNQEILHASIELDTDISDISDEPDLNKVNCVVAVTIDIAGYRLCVTKAGCSNRNVSCNSYFAKGDQMLIIETLEVGNMEFDQTEPSGAGNGQFSMDILGKIQVKANVDDVNMLLDYFDIIDSNSNNEIKVKKYVSEINNSIDNGVYFSSDIKQCDFELYPFQSNSSYGQTNWYVEPVFVLADGTMYEYISDFFSERYFSSVIDKFNELIDFFEGIEI